MNMIRFYSPAVRHEWDHRNWNLQNANLINYQPQTNIFENNESFLVDMVIPGLSKEEINISVEQNKLIVTGNPAEKKNDDLKVISQAFAPSPFEKRFTVSDKLNTELISASFSNGILRISIPKKEEEKSIEPKTIVIE